MTTDNSPAKMFTYASLENRADSEDAGALVFYGTEDLNSETAMRQIIADDSYQRVFDGVATAIYPDEAGDIIIASPDLGECVFSKMENATPSDTVLLVDAKNAVEKINLYETYYSCTLPHKLIVGCPDCYAGGPNPRDCALKRRALSSGQEEKADPPTLGDFRRVFKSRKSKVSDYIFVGPRLTSAEFFARALRPVKEHDFSQVESNSMVAQVAARERERRKKFTRMECPQCLVQLDCARYRPDFERNRCSGCYKESVKEASNTILSNVVIPYTDKELARCLDACGELRKRFRRRVNYATFALEGRILTFGFRAFHWSQFTPVLPGEDFDNTLEEFCYKRGTSDDTLTLEQKALICEFAAVSRSPTVGHGWHRTSYRAVCTQRGKGGIELTFQYNSNSRGLLPWTAGASSLANFYGHYGNFAFLQASHAPSGHRSRRYGYTY